jgi:hypothetical protein
LCRWRRYREIERLALVEYCVLQVSQVGTGVQSEAFAEHRAGPAQGRKCIGLAAAAIQGKCQLRPSAFAQRVLSDERLQLDQRGTGAVEAQKSVGMILQRQLVGLGQPVDDGNRPHLIAETQERWSRPQRQRRLDELQRGSGVCGGESHPRL